MLHELKALSPTFGDLQISGYMESAIWPFHAKERAPLGSDVIRTSNPLFPIGNSYDPITPFVSAENASADFADSVLLKSDSYGHTSLAQLSLCTAHAIRAFFVNGTLPEKGTVCQPKLRAFHSKLDQDLFYADLSKEDKHLMVSSKHIGESLLAGMRGRMLV